MPIRALAEGILDFQAGYRGTYREGQRADKRLALGAQDQAHRQEMQRRQQAMDEQYQAARMAMMDQERERASMAIAEREQLGNAMVQSIQRQFQQVQPQVGPPTGPMADLQAQIADLESLRGTVSPEAIQLISADIQEVAVQQAEDQARSRLMETIGRMASPPAGPMPDGTQVQSVLSEENAGMLMEALQQGAPPDQIAQELQGFQQAYEQDIQFSQAVNRVDSMLQFASPDLARKWMSMRPFLPSGEEGTSYVNAIGKEIVFGGTDPFLQKLVVEGMGSGMMPEEIMGYYQAAQSGLVPQGQPQAVDPQAALEAARAAVRSATSEEEAQAMAFEILRGAGVQELTKAQVATLFEEIGADLSDPVEPEAKTRRMRGVEVPVRQAKPEAERAVPSDEAVSEAIQKELQAMGFTDGDPMEFLRSRLEAAKSNSQRKKIRNLMSALPGSGE